MRPTIKDVAAKAGLSVGAVSTILNNKPSRITEATKQRVLKIAEEMNYRPNRVAANLKNNRSFTIGLIVPDIRNGYFSNLAKGVEDECRRQGWNVILCNSNDSSERELEYVEVLDSKSIDGIILNTASTGGLSGVEKIVDKLIQKGIPFVQFDLTAMTPKSNAVVMDHEKGGFMATKHLIDLGHRRIACITGSIYLEGAKSMLEGYKRALAEHDIPFDEALVFNGDYRMESGFLAMEYLNGKDFTAVFSFNDYMAFKVYQYLMEHGRSVPDDCFIVGYDDDPFSEIISPPLTTIYQPIYDMGQSATQIIIDVVEKKEEQPVIKRFSPEVIVRESTASYKK